jgi:DNA primase
MQPTEEIKARLSIIEVVSSYIRLEKAGAYFKAPCPFHQERTPSFVVNEERNMWHCFGCNKGGDIFAFVMEMESLSFREALQLLAERAGVELPRYNQEASREQKSEKERLLEALELATKFYEKQLWEGAGKTQALPYLEGRGLTHETMKQFRLGVAPEGWSHLVEFLTSKGFTVVELEKAGLALKKTNSGPGCSHYDRFRSRIMFPITDTFGKVIGYSARVLPGADENQAKYINTPETPVYHKSSVLYGMSYAKQAMKQLDEVIVVEGNMDVIAMYQAGHANTVAVSGTALTAEQLRMMKRYTKNVKLFFDMDAAGQKAARKSTELALGEELHVSLVQLAQGKDAADMARDDLSLLEQSLANAEEAPKAFLEKLLKEHDKQSAEGKRSIVEDFTTLLLAMHHPVEREHWVQMLAREVHVEERSLREALRVAARSTSGTTGANEAPRMTPKIYSSRAEVLRDEYVRLLLALPGIWQEEDALVTGHTRDYLAQHPLFFFILQAGHADPMTLITDATLQQQASRALFELFETEGELYHTDDDRQIGRTKLLQEIRITLMSEIEGKERLRQLEQELRAARSRGDAEQEKNLLTEFVQLSAKVSREG